MRAVRNSWTASAVAEVDKFAEFNIKTAGVINAIATIEF